MHKNTRCFFNSIASRVSTSLEARLVSVNDILHKKQASVDAFDQVRRHVMGMAAPKLTSVLLDRSHTVCTRALQVIGQTQEALQKIIDSSSALLSVTKRNAADVSRLVQRI